MKHRHILDEMFGPQFCEEVLLRMMATTQNNLREAQRKLDNALAYLQARATLDDPNSDLVCNLGPDEAWHVLMLYTDEYIALCENLAGVYLRHDPAEEAVLVNKPEATERTIEIFETFGIHYDPAMWCDHVMYPHGARVIRSGIAAV